MVVAVVGPMYHSAPNAYGMFCTRIGANVVLAPRFDAEELLQLIEQQRITHIHMVPIMFNPFLPP
jgi:long-chain acyl-CoA synthetase